VIHALLAGLMMMLMLAQRVRTAALDSFLLVHLSTARYVQLASTTTITTLRRHAMIWTQHAQLDITQTRGHIAVMSVRLGLLTWTAIRPHRALHVLLELCR
jgi:hypothetical protein